MSKQTEINDKILTLRSKIDKLQTEVNKLLEEERKEKNFADFKNDLQMEICGDNVIILRGGIKQCDPRRFLDTVVDHIIKILSDKKKSNKKNTTVLQFIEETLDNPWVRVLIFNAGDMNFTDGFDDVVERIKV